MQNTSAIGISLAKFLLKQLAKPAVLHMQKQLVLQQLGIKGFETQILMDDAKDNTTKNDHFLDVFLPRFIRKVRQFYVSHDLWKANPHTFRVKECLQSLFNVAQTWPDHEMSTRFSNAFQKNGAPLNKHQISVCFCFQIFNKQMIMSGITMAT